MHIGFIIEAKKAEKAILVNYLQTLKHTSVKQSKEQERESSQPCGGTLSLKQGLDRRFNAISERIRLFSTSSRFRGKHIRFEPPSSEDENIEDDDTDSDEHGNNDSNNQYQNSLKNMMEAEQRVSSCPYPSAAEEKLRLGLKVEMDGNATPGCGKSDVGKKKSGKKRKSENQYRSVKDREDNEVSLDSQRMKKMQRCSKEKNQDLSERFNVVPSPQEQHMLYQSANRSTSARSRRRKNKRQARCDYQVKCGFLELNTMESFITTWRDTCRKHSVAEIFGKMSKFYDPNRKKLPKYCQEQLGVALINVAVTSIKWGMWDSLCDTGQPIGPHKLTGPSSVQPTEMIDNGSSSKRDFALSKNQHAREAGFRMWWTLCGHSLPNLQQLAIAEVLGTFGGKHKDVFDEISIGMLKTTHPRMWWTLCGHSLPNLQQLAIKVLSQPCSASACERNWSVFEAVHTKKRNRLEPGKLHDLVYVKLNLHLQVTSKDIQAMDSTPICIENLEGFPGFEVAQVGDDQVVNIGDDEDDELGDSEEEEEDAFENLDFLNPSI